MSALAARRPALAVDESTPATCKEAARRPALAVDESTPATSVEEAS
jgi:hypothetical protein